MKKKILCQYLSKIKKPLLFLKQREIEKFEKRGEIQSLLILRNFEDDEYQNLIDEVLEGNSKNLCGNINRVKNLHVSIDLFAE